MKNIFIFLLTFYFSPLTGQIIQFKDPNFKNALVNSLCVDTDGDSIADRNADFNGDGEIDVSEALMVNSLIIEGKSITNLDEIAFFTNLKQLRCGSNQLTQLDVQNLTNLEWLRCFSNQLSSLNVQGCTSLTRLLCSNNQLTFLNVQGLTSLVTLHCEFNQLTSLNVQGFNSLTELHCGGNQLTSLNVQGCTSLTWLYCEFNHLKSLNVQGCTSLATFVCNSNQLTYLNVQGLTSLTGLYCVFNQLTSLNVQGCTSLTTLNCAFNYLTSLNVQGLTSLTTLYCEFNQLTSLNIKGIHLGIHINTVLYFHNNPNLEYICCDEDQITKIKNIALSNGQNCEVNSYCSFTPGGKFYVLNGKSLFDGDNNGCDEQDLKLSNFKYNITDGSVAGTFINNFSGNYTIPVQAGTHIITPILEHSDYFEVTPSSLTVTFPFTSDIITQDFCITPKGIFRQIDITVIPLTPPARPGFDAQYKIVWENVGNQIENGTLNFTYDETFLDYITATMTPDQVADGILKWNFTNLLPFEKREIIATLKVNRPTDTPAVNSGDKLYLTASILDNIFTLENTVVGSYDPNDKTCLQGDRIHPDLIGEYVDFLIRFENTGDFAAENVVIRDVIDASVFDISTLKITDTSHDMYTRIEGNKVEFIFENIQLPFEDDYNDGHVAFKIKTWPTLTLGDSLKNLADIYFDYNFPIRTNETETVVALPSHTQDWISDINIYPNPVKDILFIQTDQLWTKAEIFDISGRIMRAVSLDSPSIDVSGLESATYVVRLRNGEKVARVKFVKM